MFDSRRGGLVFSDAAEQLVLEWLEQGQNQGQTMVVSLRYQTLLLAINCIVQDVHALMFNSFDLGSPNEGWFFGCYA